jgi:hypothetical protein
VAQRNQAILFAHYRFRNFINDQNKLRMSSDINHLIDYDIEGTHLDFKQEEYPLGKDPRKLELLKDICAFANHPSDNDKFIIIGVKVNPDGANETMDIGLLTDEAKYQQFVQDNIEPRVNFEYKLHRHNGNQIAYFRIFNNVDRPYLFKKDVINPATGKPEYKYGDGFIRNGTSTKKIGRKELEDIGKLKRKYIDRKGSLDVTACVGRPVDREMRNLNVKYLDVDIVNSSNKSLDFDIEIRFQKGSGYKLTSEFDFRTKLRNSTESILDYTMISGFVKELITPNFNVDTEETPTEFIVGKNSRRNRTSVIMPQYSRLDAVFDKTIFLITEQNLVINAQVTIRSDDFEDDPLVKTLFFNT